MQKYYDIVISRRNTGPLSFFINFFSKKQNVFKGDLSELATKLDGEIKELSGERETTYLSTGIQQEVKDSYLLPLLNVPVNKSVREVELALKPLKEGSAYFIQAKKSFNTSKVTGTYKGYLHKYSARTMKENFEFYTVEKEIQTKGLLYYVKRALLPGRAVYVEIFSANEPTDKQEEAVPVPVTGQKA